MDNKKIGKLISSLRRQQGLTQQELGDKVGVGFRAVSKWERGLTLPDIAIINELAKILGISSDELLTGQINKNKTSTHKKLSPKLKITISIAISLIVLIILPTIYYYNKTYNYQIISTNNECFVNGTIIFNKNKVSIIVNQISFKDKEFSKTLIKNYEYEITSGNEFIYGYGYGSNGELIDKETTIKEITDKIRIKTTDQIDMKKSEIVKNGIVIKINFLDQNNNEIMKEVKTELVLSNKQE